ncbi:MAG: hypothetical protein WB677_20715 [Xanthobacteraceae bacterium]
MDRRETPAEFGQRLGFDSLDQVSENVVEHVDLLIVQPIGVRDEQVRNASQRVDALVFRPALNRLFQLEDE